jgi:hypothetical protein
LNSPRREANSIFLVLARAGKSLYLYLPLIEQTTRNKEFWLRGLVTNAIYH